MQNTTKPLQKCSWMELPRWLPCLKCLEYFFKDSTSWCPPLPLMLWKDIEHFEDIETRVDNMVCLENVRALGFALGTTKSVHQLILIHMNLSILLCCRHSCSLVNPYGYIMVTMFGNKCASIRSIISSLPKLRTPNASSTLLQLMGCLSQQRSTALLR